MAHIRPFAALRPDPATAPQLCELPYDVMSSDEARALAAGNPLSFLHVSKPEIDLPPTTDPYAPEVYQKGLENFQRLRDLGALRLHPQPALFLYRQIMGSHAQTGLVALASCQDYLDGIVKKHELTRPDKENDRVRHIETLGAQTGPAFLTYRAVPALDDLFRQLTTPAPDLDFTAPDGVRHSTWTIHSPDDVALITQQFLAIPCLYIADGHHRSAAAARLYQARQGAGGSPGFLSVIFPHHQMQILPYHRGLHDLHGLSPAQFLAALDPLCTRQPGSPQPPARRHQLGLLLEDQWHLLTFRPHLLQSPDPVELLDVTLLQRHILAPLLGIDDPRTSKRIEFIGGIRGTPELERLVRQGQLACAFALHPTHLDDLMTIADNGGIMPPKSTWFEPKLRDGLFSHLL